jgi:hypothetical protein
MASSSRFVGSARTTAVTVADAPPARPPREFRVGELPEGVEDGDLVQARLLGADGSLDVADEVALPAQRTVTGPLSVRWVETLGCFRYSVDGRSIDPATVTPVEGPTA